MSSDISVKSEPGKGSTFCFSLKLKNSLKKSGTPFQQAQADDRNLQGVRVLIAEDNKINVVLARQYMKLWGVVCDVADNGRVAFDMVQHNDYDLVLMDLQMPEMDGYQATEVIRSLPEAKYKKLPIIALTASATVDIKDIAFASGMNDYVTKPFNPKELNFKIKTHALKFADGITVRA
jgi:CheY-like chemotaxis protein